MTNYEAWDMKDNTALMLGTFPTFGDALNAVHSHRRTLADYDKGITCVGFEIVPVEG
jgi:hypothetical protein